MPIPADPKIYHIVHGDRLLSIITDCCLWCGAKIFQRSPAGTTIGMNKIKQRRLTKPLKSRRGLFVGGCVPFYFCPRSVMLYVIHMANHPELTYKGGQGPIVHLEADLCQTVAWAEKHNQRWAFTLSNAGSSYFKDRRDLAQLNEIDWNAVQARDWQHCKEPKQAEFLIEHRFPWKLVSRIGVRSRQVYHQATAALQAAHKPRLEIRSDWYY